jgi:ABC-type lipoprotein export system ATPase subunit
MIAVQHVSYQYPNSAILKFPDLAINKGGHCLLLGESGSGKTTLLHLIGGLLKSQRGSITIDQTELTTLSESATDRFRGKTIGFIFQKNHLINALTVGENLLLPNYLAGLKERKDKADLLLDKLGLTNKKNSKVAELSHGQAQRVAIARSVMNSPAVLLADEPSSSLDDKNCGRVIELLLRMTDEFKITLLIATHDQRLKSFISTNVILTQNVS